MKTEFPWPVIHKGRDGSFAQVPEAEARKLLFTKNDHRSLVEHQNDLVDYIRELKKDIRQLKADNKRLKMRLEGIKP